MHVSVSRHQPWVCAQNEVESQHQELLSQSQADISVSNNDEDEVERELRELNQSLLQMHQELMSAQAECDRARSSEEEACRTWEAKRSACMLNSLLILPKTCHVTMASSVRVRIHGHAM